jgi:hypothetical protein
MARLDQRLVRPPGAIAGAIAVRFKDAPQAVRDSSISPITNRCRIIVRVPYCLALPFGMRPVNVSSRFATAAAIASLSTLPLRQLPLIVLQRSRQGSICANVGVLLA